MGVRPIIFESAGKRTTHVIPGVYSRSASIKGKGDGVSAGNVAILGYATAGESDVLREVSNLEEAKEEFKGGELLDAIAHFFTPAKGYVPQSVFALRVGDVKHASCILKRDTTEVLKINLKEHGVGGNGVKIHFTYDEDHHTAKFYFVKSADSNDTTQEMTVRNQFMQISYHGVSNNVQCIITKDKLEIRAEGTPQESAELPFDEYPTIGSLCANIDGINNFQAILIDGRKGSVPSNELDIGTISLPSRQEVGLYGNLYGIVRALTSVDLVGSVEVLSEGNVVPSDGQEVSFAGGQGHAGTVEEWIRAIKVLEKEDINIITTPHQNEDIQNLIVGHCETMSSIENKKERTCILGGGLNEGVEDSIKRAKMLGNRLCSYTGTSIKTIDPLTGKIVILPASYFACKLAGLESCLAVNQPLTNKVMSVLEFTNKYTATELKHLILGGVLSGGKNDDGRLVVVRAITTHEGDELQDIERSMVREAIYMNRDLRHRLNVSIGKPAVSGSINDDLATLHQASNDWFASGLILKNDDGELLWNITTREDGDATFITFSRFLVAPRNFIFITVNNHVYTGSSVTVSI